MSGPYVDTIEEWLRPDETIEYQAMDCRITRDGEVVFNGALVDAYRWQLHHEQMHILNAKLNHLIALQEKP